MHSKRSGNLTGVLPHRYGSPHHDRSRAMHVQRILASAVISALLCALALVTALPPAAAHAELLQSSPAASSVVGGEFHSIVLHFGGIDWEGNQVAELFGPDGAQITTPAIIQERQRVTIPIEPLTVPGNYRVRYTIEGDDNDIITEAFTFRFDPAADAPTGVTLANGGDQGFDWISLVLLMALAALVAFLIARFLAALKEHRLAQQAASSP